MERSPAEKRKRFITQRCVMGTNKRPNDISDDDDNGELDRRGTNNVKRYSDDILDPPL